MERELEFPKCWMGHLKGSLARREEYHHLFYIAIVGTNHIQRYLDKEAVEAPKNRVFAA